MHSNTGEHINALVSHVMDHPSYAVLPESEKKEIQTKLEGHFRMVMIDTVLNRLTDEQAGELKRLLDSDLEAAEQKMVEFSAGIPTLSVEMEERLEREMEALKKLAGGS